jgi:hypothetical protein
MRDAVLLAIALLAAGGCGKCSRHDSEPAGAAPAKPPPPPAPDAAAIRAPASRDSSAVDEALRLFDHGDAAGALAKAESVLATDPANVRALRLAASSACLLGDAARARRHAARLPEPDRSQIVKRCKRHGVDLGLATVQRHRIDLAP